MNASSFPFLPPRGLIHPSSFILHPFLASLATWRFTLFFLLLHFALCIFHLAVFDFFCVFFFLLLTCSPVHLLFVLRVLRASVVNKNIGSASFPHLHFEISLCNEGSMPARSGKLADRHLCAKRTARELSLYPLENPRSPSARRVLSGWQYRRPIRTAAPRWDQGLRPAARDTTRKKCPPWLKTKAPE